MLNKRKYASFALALLLAALFLQLTNTDITEAADVKTNEVLVFLKDVVGLDLSKYEATLVKTGKTGVTITTGEYSLDSTGVLISPNQNGVSLLTVIFRFMGEELTSCSIEETSQGPAYYSQPSSDTKEAALDLLSRYQTYTNDAQISQMIEMLQTTDITLDTQKCVDNLDFEVELQAEGTSLTWSNTLNGAAYSQLQLEFSNGNLVDFSDNRGIYRLGATEVNVSQEQAEEIAIEQVEQKTSNSIVKEYISSEINFLDRGNERVLFAAWLVNIPLHIEDHHPGEVSYYTVIVWADSGEVISVTGLGNDFPYPYEATATPKPAIATVTPQTSSTGLPGTLLIACITASIIIAVIAVALKLRHK